MPRSHETQSPNTQTPDNQAQENATDPWNVFYNDVIQYAWEPALRFTLDGEGAPKRCKRRICRMSGSCHIAPRDGEPLDCGGGVSLETVRRACEHICFLYVMAWGFIEGLGISSPGFAGFLLGMDIRPPSQENRDDRKDKVDAAE
ncbi:MAG TPA: hypothetical protein VMF90_09120 [Rhizobiaceae bacterium]|nr:hypothetical protein [Rhizobiaceae bacterium]